MEINSKTNESKETKHTQAHTYLQKKNNWNKSKAQQKKDGKNEQNKKQTRKGERETTARTY